MQAPFFMKKCFCFNSYYHMNRLDYAEINAHPAQCPVMKQQIPLCIWISFFNLNNPAQISE